ncbi:immunity 63 family protein [Sphingobium sp. JS3065]|uniref:Imm63 family immunity protein n=1 Tax=Sphingobium sp. JS3065 TaxID=2970925 RepID=UPI0022649469|nr:Imm63 family immunity protein [Sphingobium sp. JS3065]UZW57322.1 immunity 63 family protein [Sphingobium sp. JS3065]
MSDALPRQSDLTSIRTMVQEYGSQIGMSNTPLFGTPQGDGAPYVVVSDAYYFIVEERGIELERRKTNDIDELLYWIFCGVTFSMASDFELRNRKPGEDSRRQLFAKQEALLGQLSAQWRERKLEEHRRILTRHPFNDVLG